MTLAKRPVLTGKKGRYPELTDLEPKDARIHCPTR